MRKLTIPIRKFFFLSISLLLTWSQTATGQHWDWANHIHTVPIYYPGNVASDDQGNAYTILQDGAGTISVRKIDRLGVLQWETWSLGGFPSSDDMNIAVDAQENVYITGAFMGELKMGNVTVVTEPFVWSMFLIKLNTAGDPVWGKIVYPTDQGQPRALAVDPSGNVILTGTVYGTAHFDTTVSPSTSTNRNAFVAKFDSNGNLLWVQRSAGSPSEAVSLDVDDQGNIYAIGSYLGVVYWGGLASPFILFHASYHVRLTPSGTPSWVKKINGQLTGIAVDGLGNSHVCGTFEGTTNMGPGVTLTSAGMTDILVAKYAGNGALIWARSAGGAVQDTPVDIGVDKDGNSFVGGDCRGSASFSGVNLLLPTQAYSVGYVAKYSANGAIWWVDPVKTAYRAKVEHLTTNSNGICYVISFHDASVWFGSDIFLAFQWHHTLARLNGNAVKIPVLEIDEAFICWPCLEPELGFEYRFWERLRGVETAIYRKTADPDNADDILQRGNRLEIRLHDELPSVEHVFQLRGILEDGTTTDWSEAVTFVPEDQSRAKVYPNPFNERIYVEYTALQPEIITLTFIDRYGKAVLRETVDVVRGSNVFDLDTQSIPETASPLTLQLVSRMQGTFSWPLIKSTGLGKR